ncbi:MAG TPA: methionine adenosyltransferase [Bacteroidales bacterium]|jgi:S-adenosylmethionine synthetase|nr:methionine adenosyltransferase [Bacteroidales bacterium]OQB61349.1 MAG: S-adenosylmethionine synthase [Bacteroidetes bacterium ADurb.Bin145]NMD04173.1 methionine adenosyltransferase [Bacteroidales bacterium]HOU01688.1 methionine adenosyltransferase [Bacteroidales bacterium]HQG63306.1 methionine adenosyltransferase [Bacteroidales bacterium]
MGYFFTSESVSEGHPDKVADQISDALLDEFLRWDPDSKVACETFVTTGLVVCGGEVQTSGWVDVQETARRVLRNIGYTKAEYRFDCDSCGVISTIHEQSPDIRQGVVRDKPEDQGAGDQGMMFGYACREMDNFMPLSIELAHLLLRELAAVRHEGKLMKYLRPDAKSQVTIEYDDDSNPLRIDTIVISTQHDEFILPKNRTKASEKAAEKAMQQKIKEDIIKVLLPRVKKSLSPRIRRLFPDDMKLLVNPTGKFVIGGPHGDTGLTGRKIIVDTYGGHGAHGGGAFSGKDSSKVDRSAAYAARHIAKNLVAAGVCDKALIQVAYAIGVAQPVGLFLNTFGTAKIKDSKGRVVKDSEIAGKIEKLFDMRPYAIVRRFGLNNPIFIRTASYGHFGRECQVINEEVYYEVPGSTPKAVNNNGKNAWQKKVELFAWEKLDYVDKIRKEFKMKP